MITKYAKYLTHICRNVIEGRKTDFVPEWLDLGEFFGFCYAHKLDGIAFLALSAIDAYNPDEQVWRIFQDKYYQSVFLDGTGAYYYDEITAALREREIAYMPMKGMILKKLYPSPDLRQSADIDLYIGEVNAEKARRAMESVGFKASAFGKFGTADEYENNDRTYVDIHRVLIRQEFPWTEECNRITGRLIAVDEYERAMSDEDFYIYMVCHIAKHMKNGGIGIRAILDVWVYLRRYRELDTKYIQEIFERCAIAEFHRKLIQLMDYWFNDMPADDLIKRMASYVAGSGWNGSEEQWVAASISTNAPRARSRLNARLKSYAKATFWSADRLSEKYPVLEKHPVLLPFCWIHRSCNALINKRGTVKEILHYYDGADISAAARINSFKKDIGLVDS